MKPSLPILLIAAQSWVGPSPAAESTKDHQSTTEREVHVTRTQTSRNGVGEDQIVVTVTQDGKTRTQVLQLPHSDPFGNPAVSSFQTVSPSRKEKVTWLGVALAEISDDLATQLPLPNGAGVRIRQVIPDSPGAQAGLRENDLIFRIDDQVIFNADQLQALIRSKIAGERVKVTFFRQGSEKVAEVKLEQKEMEVSAVQDYSLPGLNLAPVLTQRMAVPDYANLARQLEVLRQAETAQRQAAQRSHQQVEQALKQAQEARSRIRKQKESLPEDKVRNQDPPVSPERTKTELDVVLPPVPQGGGDPFSQPGPGVKHPRQAILTLPDGRIEVIQLGSQLSEKQLKTVEQALKESGASESVRARVLKTLRDTDAH